MACTERAFGVVLVFDDPGRAWLTKGFMRGTAPGEPIGWWSATLEEAQRALREFAVGGFGLLRVRVTDALPDVIEIRLSGSEVVVPVVTVDAIEQAHPDVGEVLARLRSRRDAERRSSLGTMSGGPNLGP